MRSTAAWLVVLAAAGAGGCKRNAVPVAVVEDPSTRLPETTAVAVADWINLARPELDRRCDDELSTAAKLLDVTRGDRRSLQLLPKLRPVLTLPVFQTARFSPRAGLSLPPYLEEGKKDAAVALHLARHGDADGALLLAGASDAPLRQEIEAQRAGRNYPVEWTRLVALAQFVNELRLARGAADAPDAAANLIQLHQQLRLVLDPKAAAGPLGAALLPGGRHTLEAAAKAWGDARKTGLAGDVTAALGAWGEAPEPAPALAPGAGRAELERVFPPAGNAHAAVALGAAAPRAFDLLTLPLPCDEFDGAAAFLDGQGRLAELVAFYRPRAAQVYPEPAYLTQRLADFGFPGQEAPAAKGALRCTAAAGLTYDVTLVPRGSSLGGLVRVTDGKGPSAPAFTPPDPRDFGAVHFDRTFDQNRLAIAPEQRSADSVTVTKAAEVRRVAPPGPERGRALALPPGASVQLRRLEGYDLLAGVTVRWDRGENAAALGGLAVPLWAAYGAPRFEAVADPAGGHLALAWEGESMRYTLRLPHDQDQPPEFDAEDLRGASGAAEREKAAQTFDRDQRAARLAAGKPLQRIPRAFEEASTVRLGMPRAEVQAALPASQSLRKAELADGWNVLFLKPPPASGAATPQQFLVRFGPDGAVAELRLRYLERYIPKGDPTPSLLARLTAKSGAPETLPSPWAGLWADLPPQKPSPALYRWRDDTTAMTLQRDAGGAELTLRDCPADRPGGVELPPLRFCSRGIDGCALGDDRREVLQRWKITEPTLTSDGGVMRPAKKSGPYEAVVAYFENGKVVRVLAFHRAKANFQASEVPVALQQWWGSDLDHLGCVRHQDVPAGKVVAGFGWHDDVTRVWAFALDSDQGPRLHTEWREWPVPAPAKGVAAATK
jgi:hypothetical protein